MLVLTRKRSEMIQIGDNIFVKVIRTGKNCVKIGIEAPADVRVLRAELAEHAPAAQGGVVEMFNPVRKDMPCSDQFPHPYVA